MEVHVTPETAKKLEDLATTSRRATEVSKHPICAESGRRALVVYEVDNGATLATLWQAMSPQLPS